jgi:hypothetical protein
MNVYASPKRVSGAEGLSGRPPNPLPAAAGGQPWSGT